jgi:inward rectifier potassium channel
MAKNWINDSVAPFKNTNLTDALAKVTLGISIKENGLMTNKFFHWTRMDKINLLT